MRTIRSLIEALRALDEAPNYDLEDAWGKMYEPLMQWVHQPSQGKKALLDAYNSLLPKEKAAWRVDVEKAVSSAHGSTIIRGYRRHKPGETGGLGLKSMHTDEKAVSYLGRDMYSVYEVPMKAILAHWAQEDSPLGKRSFKHEKEIVLMPNADSMVHRIESE